MKREVVDFSVDPYPLKLNFQTDQLTEMRHQLENQDKLTTTLHQTHYAITLTVILVISAITAYAIISLKKHERKIKHLTLRDIPLQSIVVLEDPETGTGQARPVERW